MGQKKCEICEDKQSKYKCPACLMPYCSLSCFKKHKEIPCGKPEPVEEEIVYPSVETNEEKPCYVDEQSEVLQKTQLQSVAASKEICDAIKDKKLQKLIYNVDCSADQETELDKAMEDETFRLFTEKILDTIGSQSLGIP